MRLMDQYYYRGPYRAPRLITFALPNWRGTQLWAVAVVWLLFGSLVATVGDSGRQQFERSLKALTAAPVKQASASSGKSKPVKPRTTTAKVRPSGGGYSYGYCTWYVASRRNMPRNWGDAYNWLSAAQAGGYRTGSKPKKGAIAWTYGHVAIVEKVRDRRILVSEMNYVGWNIVSQRWAPAGAFRYIY